MCHVYHMSTCYSHVINMLHEGEPAGRVALSRRRPASNAGKAKHVILVAGTALVSSIRSASGPR
jgi:hypothetical protein